jgi:hypothetical protein
LKGSSKNFSVAINNPWHYKRLLVRLSIFAKELIKACRFGTVYQWIKQILSPWAFDKKEKKTPD